MPTSAREPVERSSKTVPSASNPTPTYPLWPEATSLRPCHPKKRLEPRVKVRRTMGRAPSASIARSHAATHTLHRLVPTFEANERWPIDSPLRTGRKCRVETMNCMCIRRISSHVVNKSQGMNKKGCDMEGHRDRYTRQFMDVVAFTDLRRSV